MKKFLFIIPVLLFPLVVSARDNVNYWYIKDFKTNIEVREDSSVLVEERIIADCGNATDKHGIFRILPTKFKTEEKTFITPVTLLEITDFNGNPHKFSTKKTSDAITWKIGDPDITVRGENYYKIKYIVENAVRTENPNFDEFYWNLLGPFWDLEIDNFEATIVFPEKGAVDYYTGELKNKSKELASYIWEDEHTLKVYSISRVPKMQGITISVVLPKIFTPYTPSFKEKYGDLFWFLIPVIVFTIFYMLWVKYGNDPKITKTTIPEYDVPENLTPMELGMVMTNGRWFSKYITAAIINLAVKGYIKIEKESFKILIFTKNDFKLTKLKDEGDLSGDEQMLMRKLFDGKKTVMISDLKNSFYKDVKKIKERVMDNLYDKKLVEVIGMQLKGFIIFIGGAFVFFGVSYLSRDFYFGLSLVISGLISIFFGIIMAKRTEKGTEVMWKIKGFRLYMKTAEEHRQRFYEKENIFEKFLPYAIVFGMAKLWAKKMEKIYGEEYFRKYHPAWYISGSSVFDCNSFNSSLKGLTKSISANVSPKSSGAGGVGGVGGGAGGGGGGGW